MRSSCKLVALLLLANAAAANAAAKPPVTWHLKTAPKLVRQGAKFNVTLTGDLDPGWHLYALEEPDGGPVATEVALTEGDPADLLRVEEGRHKVLPDPLFQKPTGFFDTTAEFTLHLQAIKNAASPTQQLRVLIRYQSCNDRICLPPHTDTVVVPLVFSH